MPLLTDPPRRMRWLHRYVFSVDDRAIVAARSGALTLRFGRRKPVTLAIDTDRVGVPVLLVTREITDVLFEPDYPIIPRKHRAKRSGALKGWR